MNYKLNTIKIVLLLILSAGVLNNSEAISLRTYNITCDQNDFERIVANAHLNTYIDCEFEFEGQNYNNARIRLRGESSRNYPKKSFKVNFDANNRFISRDKVNLISCWLDSSYCREYFAYDFHRRAGLNCSNTWFTKLYVNDEYLGLYLDVEQIDEHFLQRADLARDASIYKADFEQCYMRLTDNLDTHWQKKTNVLTGNYDLFNLLEWVDTVNENRFFQELSQYFNTNELARTIAVNGIIGNTSTYYHNYYLIHDINENGIWKMLPWDMDKVFIYYYDFGTPSYDRTGWNWGSNLLIVKCWEDPQMRDLIHEQIENLTDSLLLPEYYSSMADTLYDLLFEAVEEDGYNQFSVEQFENGIHGFSEIAEGRAARIAEKLIEYPVSFNLKEAIVSPRGVYFSWNDTFVPDGTNLTYRITIDTLFSFYSEYAFTISDIEDCNFLYAELPAGIYFWKAHAVSDRSKKTKCLDFFSPFTVPDGGFEGSTFTGHISENTAWTSDHSPVSLPEGLTIDEGVTLRIGAGVIVGLGNEQSLNINGALIINGSESHSVSFVPNNPQEPWQSIRITNPTGEVRIDRAVFNGGTTPFSIENGSLTLSNSQIKNSKNAIESHDSNIDVNWVHFNDISENIIHSDGGTFSVRNSRFSHGPGVEEFDLISLEGVEQVTVDNCNFFGGSEDGLDFTDVQNVIIRNNRISRISGSGIFIDNAPEAINIQNTIINNCYTGISLLNSRGVSLYNSVISFNNQGLWISSDNPGYNCYARNLILWRNDQEIVLNDSAEIDIAYSLVRGVENYPGEGNHNSDANFLDQWNNNYYLRTDSPLIDAGWGTGHPELDKNYRMRGNNPDVEDTGAGAISYVDIGAFEYQVDQVEGADPEPPHSYLLLTAYPNPFNSVVNLKYSIQTKTGKIYIYDLNGKMIKGWEELSENSNHGRIIWEGNTNTGIRVSSGLYFCQLIDGEKTLTRKIILIR